MLITIGFFLGLIGLILWEVTPVGERFFYPRTIFQIATFAGILLTGIGFAIHAWECV